MMNTPIKLLWFDLNASFAHTSLALPAIHAQIQNEPWCKNLQWDVISATLHLSVNTVVCQIVEKQPDIIAATAWLFTTDILRSVLARVKALLPECVIILGGPEFLGNNEEYLRCNSYVDAVLRGEGEESLPQWLERFLAAESATLDSDLNVKNTFKGITGFCFIDSDKQYTDNGHARVTGFANLKAPEISLFYRADKAFIQLETTRGCFNTCAFCVSGTDRPVRRIVLEEIRRRLDFYVANGITHIRLLDRTFNANSQYAHQLLDIFEEYASKLSFHLEVHPALLGEALRERLKQLPNGVLHLEAGIQSLRQSVLTASTRLGSLENSLEGLAFLCSLDNLEVHADLIAGLPLYSWQDMVDDVITLAKLKVGEIQLELLKVLPGTEMRRKAAELNLRYSPLAPYEILQSDAMSASDLEKSKQLSRMLDLYYNAQAWQALTQQLIADNRNFLLDFLQFLSVKQILHAPVSLEKCGLLLFEFTSQSAPDYQANVAFSWIMAGLPQTKIPFKALIPYFGDIPENIKIIKGNSTTEMRYFTIHIIHPSNISYLIGYDRHISTTSPAFIAKYFCDL